MKKILTIVGARPQFIKAAPVSRALAEAGLGEVLLHTGQHYDRNLSEVFFGELGLRAPDINLEAGSGSHAEQTAAMLPGIEKAILNHRPDAVLIYGDTNSTLAGALVAAKLHVPVAHVEAGLRSFNLRMPEEVNRLWPTNSRPCCSCRRRPPGKICARRASRTAESCWWATWCMTRFSCSRTRRSSFARLGRTGVEAEDLHSGDHSSR